MATLPLRIELSSPPDLQGVTTDVFVRAVRELETMMREVAGALAATELKWYLTDLAIGSGIAEITGEWAALEGDRVLTDTPFRELLETKIPDTVVSSLEVLNGGEGVLPEGFTLSAIEAAMSLARLRSDEVIAVQVSVPQLKRSVRVTEHVIATANDLMARQYADFGAIEGQMTMASISRPPYQFAVRDEVWGGLVLCTFRLESADAVRSALLHRVSVRGLITYSERGVPLRVRGVEAIDIIDTAQDLVIDNFVGIAPDFTEGMPAEEYLRRNWDESEPA